MNNPIAAIEAERVIVGAVLQNADLLHEARGSLRPADFYDGQMRRLFSLFCEMADEGRAIDLVALTQFIADRKADEMQLALVASDCSDRTLRKASLSAFVAEVLDASRKRALWLLADELRTRTEQQGETAETLIAEYDQKLLDVAAEGVAEDATLEQQTYDVLATIDAQQKGERPPCYDTGISLLDVFAGGLGIGELTIVAGRPSMGKSCCVSQAVVTNCPRGIPVHVFSIEMTADELLRRIWSAASGIPAGRVSDPRYMNAEERQLLRRAALTVSQWPLRIDDSAVITTDQIIAKARTVRRKLKTGIVAVDYLQRITFPGTKSERYMHVGDAAKRLAEFAKSEGCAAMLLSSLTERTGSGANVPPSLTDLRESGDIQYHAHKAYLIHREREEGTGISPETRFLVAKNRHGRTGVVAAQFNSDSLMFRTDKEDGHVM